MFVNIGFQRAAQISLYIAATLYNEVTSDMWLTNMAVLVYNVLQGANPTIKYFDKTPENQLPN